MRHSFLEREEIARRSPTMIGDQRVPERAMGTSDHEQVSKPVGEVEVVPMADHLADYVVGILTSRTY